MSSKALNQRNQDKENMDATSFLKKDDMKKSGVAPKALSRSRRLAVSSALNVDKKNHDERHEIKKQLDNSRKAEKGKKVFNETLKGNLVIGGNTTSSSALGPAKKASKSFTTIGTQTDDIPCDAVLRMTTIDLQAQSAARQKTFEELQEETEKMYSELEDYRESNELIAEMIVDTDKEMAELEDEYDRLKAFIEEGQKAVGKFLGYLEEDNTKSDE